MVSGDSPAVARRRLRIALRSRREAAELTQGDVAAALEWSLSKVQRIESGEVSVSSTDLRALLTKFGVDDPAAVAELIQEARTARRRTSGWWDGPRYRSLLTPALMQLMQFEGQATTIRFFASTILPGILQTPAHAEAVLGFWHAELNMITEDERAARLEVRLRRHENIFERPDRPTYLLAIDESVLYREVGSREIALAQFQHLLKLIAEGKVILRVVPFSLGAFAVTLGSFTLLDLGSAQDAVLYRESWQNDEIIHAPEEVSRHHRIFDVILARSYGAERSGRLLEARIAALRAESDS
ncbi:helix-turn-helix domain-containing protein [Catellatospora methionotrophica]|uniref:helix-turn-helix domain-containing protein n=1 Tax=Catellatospora methionotrophica TaxID=121620 RepID=UPI0033FDD9ED